MKLPVAPPSWAELATPENFNRFAAVGRLPQAEVDGEYLHWDKLRHLTPPEGFDHTLWWFSIKLARFGRMKPLPVFDKEGRHILFATSESIERRLFYIGRDAAGTIKGLDKEDDATFKDRYLMRSLIEEAMTSSQLEGAATTPQIAKDMLRSGRKPRDYGERMIYNNFATMRELKRWVNRPLTPDAVFEIHRMLTDGTLKQPDWAGRFRTAEDNIVVEDEEGRILHVPPKADELSERLRMLCAFANDTDDRSFLHPVARAVLIHFQIGYDHPFCDGNGRVARALFYWSMLRSGFWLMEYVSISSILKNAPGQYKRAYLHAETDATDATYFVDHQLDVILSAIDSLHAYLRRKREERRRVELLLKPGSELARRLNHRQRALLLDALQHPQRSYTIEGHRSSHDVTYQTARSDLLSLETAKLLLRHKHGRNFVFVPAADLPRMLDQ